MKIVYASLVFSFFSFGLSATAQSLPPKPDNWGPTKEGVRASLSVDKLTYAVGEEIPLHIAAQVASAERPVYGDPDAPEGAFWKPDVFSRAFHLIVTDEDGVIIGNSYSSNLQLVWSGSSGPDVCPEPLEVGRVYTLEQTANRRQQLLPTKPGTYRLTVTWSPYSASRPPCDKLKLVDPGKLRSFVTVSSVPIAIHIKENPQ